MRIGDIAPQPWPNPAPDKRAASSLKTYHRSHGSTLPPGGALVVANHLVLSRWTSALGASTLRQVRHTTGLPPSHDILLLWPELGLVLTQWLASRHPRNAAVRRCGPGWWSFFPAATMTRTGHSFAENATDPQRPAIASALPFGEAGGTDRVMVSIGGPGASLPVPRHLARPALARDCSAKRHPADSRSAFRSSSPPRSRLARRCPPVVMQVLDSINLTKQFMRTPGYHARRARTVGDAVLTISAAKRRFPTAASRAYCDKHSA